jgi:hypothetical protein
MNHHTYNRILRIGSLMLAVILTCCASASNASEYGISTYRPGIMDLFSGYLADPGTSIVKNYFLFQETSGDATTPNGALTAKSRTTTYTDATFAAHTTELPLLGAYWAYGGIVQERIADQSLRFGPTAHLGPAQNLTIGGLGDLELLPEMLAWKLGNFHLMEGLAIYAPTGEYDKNSIISIGNNRWAMEPDLGVTWMDPESGRHLSLFTGYTINAENTATHYHSGQEFHTDFVAAQHLPMGFVFGVAGYALQQTTADTGSGAIFGPYEGRVLGLGPLAGKTFQVGSIPLTVTGKYDFEFAAANRCVGNELWLTAGIRF